MAAEPDFKRARHENGGIQTQPIKLYANLFNIHSGFLMDIQRYEATFEVRQLDFGPK